MALRFSVIVPAAAGEPLAIGASLDALEAPAGAVEVLVERGPNPSRNRNRAIARATGDVLAFADDDCVVPPDWLRRAEAFFDAHPDWDVVGGPQLTPASDGFFGRVSGWVLASPIGAGRMSTRYRRRPLDLAATETSLSSANLFIRRRAIERVGTFDPRLWPNEETDLLRRIERAGGRIAYDPSIVVHHHRRPGLAGFARQCRGYGRGRARQVYLSGDRPSASVVAPTVFLLFVLALPMLLAWSPLWLVPLAGYLAATLAASIGIARAHRDPAAAALLPFVFLTIHLAYPAGFLVETIRLHTGGSPTPRASDDEALAPAAPS